LVAAYGDRGRGTISSVWGKRSRSPYTDEDEAKTTVAGRSRAASNTLRVPEHVHVGVALRLFDRSRHRLHRRLVKDRVAPLRRARDGVAIANVCQLETNLRHVGELLGAPDRQIVQADHVVTLGDEPPADRRPDEPGGACDEVSHVSRSLSSQARS
jgi:hypothetical protein